MLASLARVALVENVYNRKVSDYSNLKIISPKQMLQRLPIAHVQVKVGNTSENLLNDINKSYIRYIKQQKLLKNYMII